MTGHFRSFRSRLVVVFLGLFVVIQATGYVAVAAFVRTSARQHVEEELRLATTLFARQLDERGRQLVAATRLLSGDFALKTAAATADDIIARYIQRVGGIERLDAGESPPSR